jgi:uncharacterized membrane protein
MKKYLLTGLVILLPVALTAMIVFFLFDLFTAPFVPLVSSFLHHFSLHEDVILFLSRIIAFVLLSVFITLLGMVAQHIFFKNLARAGNWIIYRIPFVKTIYKVSRDIFTAIFSPDGKQAFKDAVMFPFPDKPNYGIGFLAGSVAEECQEKIGEPLESVFFPTAPHPISGFLFLVPKKDISSIDMTKEDALKYLVSCGVIHPPGERIDLGESPYKI